MLPNEFKCPICQKVFTSYYIDEEPKLTAINLDGKPTRKDSEIYTTIIMCPNCGYSTDAAVFQEPVSKALRDFVEGQTYQLKQKSGSWDETYKKLVLAAQVDHEKNPTKYRTEAQKHLMASWALYDKGLVMDFLTANRTRKRAAKLLELSLQNEEYDPVCELVLVDTLRQASEFERAKYIIEDSFAFSDEHGEERNHPLEYELKLIEEQDVNPHPYTDYMRWAGISIQEPEPEPEPTSEPELAEEPELEVDNEERTPGLEYPEDESESEEEPVPTEQTLILNRKGYAPCPFCGDEDTGEIEIILCIQGSREEDAQYRATVGCTNPECGAQISASVMERFTDQAGSRAEAYEKARLRWNRRAGAADTARAVTGNPTATDGNAPPIDGKLFGAGVVPEDF